LTKEKGLKRTLVRSLLGALVLAGVVPFVLPLRDGRPLLDYRTLRAPALPRLALPDIGTGEAGSAPVTLYKWRGAEGEWQFGNAEPPAGTPFERLTVDPGANLIQALRPELPAAAPADPAASAGGLPIASPLDAYSPAKVQQTMDGAHAARAAMDRHSAAQEALLNGR
jgi:hypothetical protein